MLNIPNEVKALFSGDAIHKNFHVHFPNGETSDLNNENILSESVAFTESLCSQQYFKFGLAEASQIEFTAVGIPNIRGAYIECAIEIDCTRLGDDWALAHLPDNTLPFLTPQTCVYDARLYYRVPYGRFKVDTCPRGHGAMTQRRITAYSEIIHQNEQMSPFEIYKLNLMLGFNPKYTANIKRLVFANIGYFNPEILSALGYTETFVKGWTGTATASSFLIQCDQQTVLKFSYTKQDVRLNDTLEGTNKLYKLDVGQYDFDAFYSLVEYLDEHYHITYAGQDKSISEWLRENKKNPCVYFTQSAKTQVFSDTGIPSYDDIENGIPCFYPYRAAQGYWVFRADLYDTLTVSVIAGGETEIESIDFTEGLATAGIYEWVDSDDSPLADVEVSFAPTLTTMKTSVEGAKTYKYNGYSYANAYSYADIMKGFLEICGLFLKPNRSGTLDFFEMSANPTAIAVLRSDWAEFWWDETSIEEIGTVKVVYSEKNTEQQETFSIGSGKSVYTIEDNEVLIASDLNDETLQGILDTFFKPNASVVNFTPADISMRGLPFLEAGDYIQLIAEDDTEVNTYILEQTISGIQHLRTEITSTNGELLEVIDNE